MATTSFTPETTAQTPSAPATLLICLPSISSEAQAAALAHLEAAFPGESLLLAGASISSPNLHTVDYAQPRSQLGWVLAAADYATAAATLASNSAPSSSAQNTLATVLLLGTDASTLPIPALHNLVAAVRAGADIAVPRYPIGPNDALVSTSLLYPLTRALFATDIRFPLPVDAALSPRLLQRLASAAVRIGTGPQGTENLLWPITEAAAAGFTARQIDAPERTLPSPPDLDINALLTSITGSLFADIEAKAAFWQRARTTAPAPPASTTPDQTPTENSLADPEIASMVDNFRLASDNLTEIWSLVLPPQSLLALKKLARTPPSDFTFDPSLWARVVYDFAMAFRLRTLNRGHLLGAMTPLYLAWVASHIRAAQNDSQRSARLAEATAEAFEREKPYFLSRWRWPDRFNP
jgi:hypothetical protein